MKKTRSLLVLFLVICMLVLNVQTVLAFPPLPSGFYGTVKIDGVNVPNDTVIYAEINGHVYASAVVILYNGGTVYSLDVPGNDTDTPDIIEGGVEGDTVVFLIGTIQATQTGIWHSGTDISFNLTGFTNHAPTDISLSNSSVAENAATNTVVGTLSSTDADAGNTFTYTLVSGTGSTDNGSFNISVSSLRATAAFDYEMKSSYTVRIRTTDQGGLYVEKVFTISVTDVNEAPTDISLSNSSIAENAAANTVVGTLSSTDVDAGNTFAYTLVSGTGSTDNGSFNISVSSLRATTAFDYEMKSSYTVRIRTTDQGGLYVEKVFTISVTNVNEAPVITEGTSAGVLMSINGSPIVFDLTLHATDVDAGDTLSWSISSPASHGTASASGSGYSKAIGYTPNLNYVGTDSFIVQVSDGKGGADTIIVTVDISAITQIPLYTGWNLVSFNIHPDNTAITDVLASIAGDFNLVYAWNATSGSWMKYDPDVDYGNTLAVLDETMGFWIQMDTSEMLVVSGTLPVTSSITLKSGWNLVGFPASTESCSSQCIEPAWCWQQFHSGFRFSFG